MLDNLDNGAQPNLMSDNSDLKYHPQTEKSVFPVLNLVINIAWKYLLRNSFLTKHKREFSSIRIVNLINQVNDMHFNPGLLVNSHQKQHSQPKPLLIDSLMPISADLDSENAFKKLVNKRSSMDQNVIKTKLKERENGIVKKQNYIKLDNVTEPQQQNETIKLLRRKYEQKSAQMLTERKGAQKKERFKLQQLKNNKNQKQQNFCYDYNGQIIQIKLQNKANLISKLINGKTNKDPKIDKPIRDTIPTTLEGSKPGKKDQKQIGSNHIKKKDEVEFSQVKSLADNIKTTEGVKYVYEGKTFEGKKKVLSTLQLKKTLSQRRLSRDEFQQLKELRGNHQNYEDTIMSSVKESNIKNQRSYSEAKLPTSRITSKSKEVIIVNDSHLRLKMLEKPNQTENPSLGQMEVQSVLSSIERLGTIDNYNLQYMKTGGSVDVANFAKEHHSQRTGNNQLPKITHGIILSKVLPKGRQKRRDAHQILRQVRRKFQDKLRV